jgi:hypothetical protein
MTFHFQPPGKIKRKNFKRDEAFPKLQSPFATSLDAETDQIGTRGQIAVVIG